MSLYGVDPSHAWRDVLAQLGSLFTVALVLVDWLVTLSVHLA